MACCRAEAVSSSCQSVGGLLRAYGSATTECSHGCPVRSLPLPGNLFHWWYTVLWATKTGTDSSQTSPTSKLCQKGKLSSTIALWHSLYHLGYSIITYSKSLLQHSVTILVWLNFNKLWICWKHLQTINFLENSKQKCF